MIAKDILEKVRSLNFPAGEYIVAGSAIMVMHNLKETKDIDIVVSSGLFDTCSADDSWEKIQYTYIEKLGKYFLNKREVELYLDVNHGEEFRPSLEELLSRAEYFEGIPFLSLEDLLKFKKSYGRPKDPAHIELIEECLKSRPNSSI